MDGLEKQGYPPVSGCFGASMSELDKGWEQDQCWGDIRAERGFWLTKCESLIQRDSGQLLLRKRTLVGRFLYFFSFFFLWVDIFPFLPTKNTGNLVTYSHIFIITV